MTTKVEDLIASKLKIASVTATEDELRKLRSNLKQADITNVVSEQDTKIANRILDKAIFNMYKVISTSSCPRCKGPMVGTKLATRRLANYCTSCRVVTPQS